MNQTYVAVTALEDLLVREFRTCQTLHELTKSERHVFTKNQVTALAGLVEEKEALLDEMGQMEDERRMVVQELAQMLGLKVNTPTVRDIATALGAEDARRLNSLRDGILALTEIIVELTSGNRALALAAIERADALQSFLLDLYRPAIYQHPGPKPRTEQVGLAWDIDQAM